MSATEDAEWNEICARIALEEETFKGGNGSVTNVRVSNTAGLRSATDYHSRNKHTNNVEKQYEWDARSPTKAGFRLDSSENKVETFGVNANIATPRSLEKELMAKQGEIAILRRKLEKAEKEKFEALEASKTVHNNTQKRDSADFCELKEKLRQLQAEVERLGKLNEFYRQEIESGNNVRSETRHCPYESARIANSTVPKDKFFHSNGNNCLTETPFVSATPPRVRKKYRKGSLIQEFDSVIRELNNQDCTNRDTKSHVAPVLRVSSFEPKELISKTSSDWLNSREVIKFALSLDIPPWSIEEQKTNCFTLEHERNNGLDRVFHDILPSLRKIVLNIEEQNAIQLLICVKKCFSCSSNVQNKTLQEVENLIKLLVDIFASSVAEQLLEDVSVVLFSLFCRCSECWHLYNRSGDTKFDSLLDIFLMVLQRHVTWVTVENILTIIYTASKLFLDNQLNIEDIESWYQILQRLVELSYCDCPSKLRPLVGVVIMSLHDILYTYEETPGKFRSCLKTNMTVFISYLLSQEVAFQRVAVYSLWKFGHNLLYSDFAQYYPKLIERVTIFFLNEFYKLLEIDSLVRRRNLELLINHSIPSELLSNRQIFPNLHMTFNPRETVEIAEIIPFLKHSVCILSWLLREAVKEQISLELISPYCLPLLSALRYVAQGMFDMTLLDVLAAVKELIVLVSNILKTSNGE